MKSVWWALTFFVGLLSAGMKKGVAPWDFPDLASPEKSVLGPRIGDPDGMTRAEGLVANLPNEITVELVSVARRTWKRPSWLGPTLIDALPVWQPDGAPFLHRPPEVLQVGSSQPFEDRVFDDRGARHLTFRVSGPSGAEIDLLGYVPDSVRQGETSPERHGRQAHIRETIPESGSAIYEVPIVIDDHDAQHYRVSVAVEPWKTVASVPLDLKDPTGNVVLARGDWGVLHQDAHQLDQLRKANGYSGPGPGIEYGVDAPEPRRFATRLRFVDAQGIGKILDEVPAWESHPVRVEVDIRPYAWTEFSDVRYDPDPAKWPAAYWGKEGEKAESRVGETTLRAIVAHVQEGDRLFPSRVYAPDGKLWRAFPDARTVNWGWIVPPDMPKKLIANIELGPSSQREDGWGKIRAFASEGNVPGQGLGELLEEPSGGRGIVQYPFNRPRTPYVQFRVDYANPWKKIGEILPPGPKEIKKLAKALLSDETASRDKEGRVVGALLVLANADSHANMTSHNNALPARMGAVRWQVEPDKAAHVVIRMRSGAKYILQGSAIPSLFYAKNAGPWFKLDKNGELWYEHWDGKSSKPALIPLRDVAAFEIETQDLGAPVFLVGKVPPLTP